MNGPKISTPEPRLVIGKATSLSAVTGGAFPRKVGGENRTVTVGRRLWWPRMAGLQPLSTRAFGPRLRRLTALTALATRPLIATKRPTARCGQSVCKCHAEKSRSANFARILTAVHICKRTRPVLVLYERKSRVTLAARLVGKIAAETIAVMLAVFARIEPTLRRSITFDNDTAFAQHVRLKTMCAMTTWFCDAYASWQTGGAGPLGELCAQARSKARRFHRSTAGRAVRLGRGAGQSRGG